MIGEFLTAIFSIRWDGKYFNGWNFYLNIFSNWQENWAGRNFITNSRVYSLLITQAKMQTEIKNNQRMEAFWPIGPAQIISIVSYPIRKKSRFWHFCMWSVKEMYHALLPNTDYRDKGRGHDRRLNATKQQSFWRIFRYSLSSIEVCPPKKITSSKENLCICKYFILEVLYILRSAWAPWFEICVEWFLPSAQPILLTWSDCMTNQVCVTRIIFNKD